MADKQLGIANLKPMLALIIEMGNVGDAMGRTSGAARYGQLLQLIDELAVVGGVQMNQVVPEFEDLDDAEKAELMNFVKDKFAIADKHLEGVIEAGLGILADAVAIVEKAIALVKAAKV